MGRVLHGSEHLDLCKHTAKRVPHTCLACLMSRMLEVRRTRERGHVQMKSCWKVIIGSPYDLKRVYDDFFIARMISSEITLAGIDPILMLPSSFQRCFS